MSLSRATSRLLAVSSRAGVVARSAPALISAGRPSVFACRPRPSQARAFASVSDPLNVSTPKAGTPATAAEPPLLPAALRLKTGQSFEAISFGAPITDRPMSGEVVFTTSLVGYPESMTDPSYRGQILVFTQPLIGNYGVPGRTVDEFGLLEHFESGKIHLSGIIVNDYATRYSHWRAVQSLGAWCASEGIPALTDVDTRALVHILRGQGSTLGEIRIGKTLNEIKNEPLVLEDPNVRNLCAEVSVTEPVAYNTGGDVKIALVDCGSKINIVRCLAKRGAQVIVVPWDHDFTKDATRYDGVFISNGPGDPRAVQKTADNLKKLFDVEAVKANPMPIFGICMGNLLMGMAAGFKAYKLKFGNRGHNQPAINMLNKSCVITSQNHGYALEDAVCPPGWEKFFVNANDGSNEGIRHTKLPFGSVQFHPEAKAGPQDTEYLFDDFLSQVRTHVGVRQGGQTVGAQAVGARA